MTELRPTPEDRIQALESLCGHYREAIEISLGNLRSIQAASHGVRTYDEWANHLERLINTHPGSFR